MGIKERKNREKKELREKIIAATAEILIKEGYEKTTIRKVAEAIEYSPRTVYLYFKDKDSLLMEIIEEGFGETISKKAFIRERLDYSKPEEIFGLQLRNNVMTAVNSPMLYRAIVYLIQFKDYSPGPNQRAVMADVNNDIRLCYEAVGKESPDPDIKTDLVFAFIRGFNLMIINKLETLTQEKLEKYLQSGTEAIIRGVIGL